MIDIRLFRYRLFTSGNLVMFFSGAAFGGLLFLLPLMLQSEMGMSPLESGMTTFPSAIGVMLTATLAGKLYNSVGPRRLMIVGMAISALITLAFLEVDASTSAWTIRALMLLRGSAFGLALVPLQAATFAEVTGAETGQASAAFSVIRLVSSSVGVALVATVLTARLGVHDAIMGSPATVTGAFSAFHDTFIVATIVTTLAIGAAFLVSDKLAASTMNPAAVEPELVEFEDEELELAAD
jgi:MFS family permease